FLSMAVIVMEKDIQHIQRGAFKVKEPCSELLGKRITDAKNERRELRKAVAEGKIQVVTLDKNDNSTCYLCGCQRREEQRNYFNPAIRKKVEAIIRELMQKVLQSHRRYTASANS